ncbi:LuxR C-terminal-related transcriptional regulator [Kutzneria buriramensis]|uniref:Non-specific serine/threonine protein kinase n=1 Tax=Kutzneria buriramensis TaxID=1045776 RepID=A0A3E0HQ73_9PSEU|nr:LuxR C-terminal-related transcriptional regulator [Kutzneria buriramensis]REH48574.1 non-specific serine/threonine protein kinase [Kutzneria buriramensis]
MTGAHRGRLPVELTSFVGRRQEFARIRATLDSARLVTLTGAGGIGKTRLATRIAADLAGVCFVDLTPLAAGSGVEQVAGVVAESLGLQDGMRPDLVVAHGRQLFVLDNCEHVLAGAAAFTLMLVQAGAKVLATSREPLRVDGEHVIDVPPLPVSGEALELLTHRARQTLGADWEPGAETAAAVRLCQRLDGLPLAIELAVPMMRAIPLETLADSVGARLGRLTATPQPHHRTLHVTFAWSHELCADKQRLLWRRLAVFPASFDLAAVTAVCSDDGLSAADVLPTLAELVDKSVVRKETYGGRVRWRMLQPVREYAAELLATSGEQDVLMARHRDYYLGQTEGWASAWVSANEVEYLHAFEHDMPHLRQALEWSLTTPGQESAGQLLAVNLARSHAWFAMGNLREGQEWLRRAQEVDAAAEGQAFVLATSVWLAALRGEAELTGELLPVCRAAAVAVGPSKALTVATNLAEGTYRWLLHGEASGVEQLELARESSVEMGSERFLATLFCGIAHSQLGDADAARAALLECREIVAADGAEWTAGWADWLEGLITRHSRPADAAELFARNLRRQVAIGDVWGAAWSLLMMGWTAAALGDYRRAVRLMGASNRQLADIGVRFAELKAFQAERLGWEAVVGRALSSVEHRRILAAGESAAYEDSVRFALGTDVRGGAELTKRELEVAERVAAGLTTPQIARALFVGERTVETHISHIMRKLGVTRRAAIAAWMTGADRS